MDETTRLRHERNRADLVAIRDGLKAKWDAEDEYLAARRAREMESINVGLAAHDAAVAAQGGPPPPVEPGRELVPVDEPVAMEPPVVPQEPVLEGPVEPAVEPEHDAALEGHE